MADPRLMAELDRARLRAESYARQDSEALLPWNPMRQSHRHLLPQRWS